MAPVNTAGSPGPGRGWRRLSRAALLAGTSTTLGLAAHAAGGGGWSWPVVLLAGLPVWLLALVLTARCCRFPLIATVLTAQQVVLHVLLSGAADGSPCSPLGAGHHGAGPLTNCALDPSVASSLSAPAMSWLPSVPMLLAHVVATLLVAWLLARGEAALWRVAATLWRPWPKAGPQSRLGTQISPRYRTTGIRLLTPAGPAAPRGPPSALPVG